MTKEHKAIFDALRQPFPKEGYKKVAMRGGFTSIDAYHIVERLTEVFGLCGIGWGVCGENREGTPKIEVTSNGVAAIGHLWFKIGDETGFVVAVGDATVMKGNVAEAGKKAITNLISKASSYIGVGLSVYKGLGIDDPYLDKATAPATKTLTARKVIKPPVKK